MCEEDSEISVSQEILLGDPVGDQHVTRHLHTSLLGVTFPDDGDLRSSEFYWIFPTREFPTFSSANAFIKMSSFSRGRLLAFTVDPNDT